MHCHRYTRLLHSDSLNLLSLLLGKLKAACPAFGFALPTVWNDPSVQT